jgi:hypothetical protein
MSIGLQAGKLVWRRGNMLKALSTIGVLAATACAPPVPGDPDAVDSVYNIAKQILPGEWEVLDEPVVFRFDSNGIPVEISNVEDPDDWKTNLEFGTSRRISTPVGALDFVFDPGRPLIDSRTGEAAFNAYGTGTNINALGIPVIGSGYATAEFTGFYDEDTGELTGTIRYEIFYQSVSIYKDQHDYILVKAE